jgi:hypothetical protein
VKRRLIKWILICGALGLVVPAIVALHSPINDVEFKLWPSSIMFLAVADAPDPVSKSYLAGIWAITVGSNILLYTLVGLLTSPIVYFVTRQRKVS